MKWGLNVSLKYLTPSCALRDSRLRSSLCISASPTSLFFTAGPRLLPSSTVRSNQSSISSSHLNQEVTPLNSGGIFVVISLAAVHWSVDSARYAPTKDSTGIVFRRFGSQCDLPHHSLLKELRSHQDLPHNHSSLVLLNFEQHSSQ